MGFDKEDGHVGRAKRFRPDILSEEPPLSRPTAGSSFLSESGTWSVRGVAQDVVNGVGDTSTISSAMPSCAGMANRVSQGRRRSAVNREDRPSSRLVGGGGSGDGAGASSAPSSPSAPSP